MRDEKHRYEWDISKSGNNGFKRLDDKGREDIRSLIIPTESGLATRLGKIVNSKRRGRKG